MALPLLPLILERIRARGPMTVAEYVDLALYHPEGGYYATATQRSGRSGDFFTSVDVGPLFGGLLAVQIAEMLRILGAGAPASASGDGTSGPGFDLVEAAAGNGRLARDILDALEARDPDLLAALRVHLVERSPQARAAQPGVLGPHAPKLTSSGPDVPAGVTGVILANELLDALPPNLVVRRKDGLREVFVDAVAGTLVTRECPPSSPLLQEYLDEVRVDLETGCFAEINLAASAWVREAARRLARGFLILIDYGHEARRLYSAAHADGTLTSYLAHVAEPRRSGPGWLEDPGARDITSHVDLTGIGLAAEAEGLDPVGVADQTYFLLALVAEASSFIDGLRGRLALKTLLMPGGLGSSHKVLVFSRGVGERPLVGFSAERLT